MLWVKLGIYFFISWVCGLLAAIAQALLNPASQIPMVGALTAISGVNRLDIYFSTQMGKY